MLDLDWAMSTSLSDPQHFTYIRARSDAPDQTRWVPCKWRTKKHVGEMPAGDNPLKVHTVIDHAVLQFHAERSSQHGMVRTG